MTPRAYRFGFVGCGPIARCHADVVSALGHSVHAVCTRSGSSRRDAFVRDYGVQRTFERVDELLNSGDIDALVVATPCDQTERVVEQVAAARVPALIEKPVALSAEWIERLMDRVPEASGHLQVGYNRRFYDFIPELKNTIEAGEVLAVSASFPDALDFDDDCVARIALQYISSHGLDLLQYLFGELTIVQMFRQAPAATGGHRAYDGLLLAENRVPIHLQIHFNAPSLHLLSFGIHDRVYQLSPIETLTVYRGMDRVEPTPEQPIRRYNPCVERTAHADARFKPGFERQMVDFIQTRVAGARAHGGGCSLPDALRVLRLCEAIAGRPVAVSAR